MPLRSGKEYLNKTFPRETMPFNMVLLPEMGKQYKIDIDYLKDLKKAKKYL